MNRLQLKIWLDEGLSLEQIGALVDRHPSTVGYWVKKHGLVPNGRAKHAPKDGLTRGQLLPLINEGLTFEEIGGRLDRSASNVRYWVERLDLPKPRDKRRGATASELAGAGATRRMICRRHGPTEFVRRPDGYWRCKRCRVEAVMARRRKVKRILVAEAGGCCALCGYDRTPAALQFHHMDRTQKRFGLSVRGNTRAIAQLREEARKCVLLCANCHVEVERGIATLR